jgi:hypothetical protein
MQIYGKCVIWHKKGTCITNTPEHHNRIEQESTRGRMLWIQETRRTPRTRGTEMRYLEQKSVVMVIARLLVVVGGGRVMVMGVGTLLGGAGFEFNTNSRQL